MYYDKPPLSSKEHIELLKDRGLLIDDETRVAKYLEKIGYFRLTGYMFHLQTTDGLHNFEKDTHFNDIIQHYQFDNKLRILLFTYLERIELAIRAQMNDLFSINHGFFWYTKQELYADNDLFNYIDEEVKNKYSQQQERFLKSYQAKYYSETYPPSNMMMELLTFGKLSKLYKGLKNLDEKQEIARSYDVPNNILESWLIHLTNVRNKCAHHSRIWNRRFTANQPLVPKREKYAFNGELPQNFTQTIYGIISIMIRILSYCNPENSFEIKVKQLIDSHPKVNTIKMGFPINWQNNPAWKTWVSND